MVPGCIKAELGGPSRDDEIKRQGLSPFEVLSLNSLESLERLRKLYEAAPQSIRNRVPEVRRKILEDGPTADLLKEDEARTERLQRAFTWENEWLNRWLALSGDEQDEITRMAATRQPEPLAE
ncbi:MAG: hypothetical protein WD423_07295 [Rhodothermales bacterium]